MKLTQRRQLKTIRHAEVQYRYLDVPQRANDD